ncbi:MAG: hypothetical protein NVSMB62_27680 [Acidobacteriaceae bacterium]
MRRFNWGLIRLRRKNVGLAIVVTLSMIITYYLWTMPHVQIVSRQDSPDGKWTVLVEYEEFGNSFGSVYSAVVVQRNLPIARVLWSKKILELSQTVDEEKVIVNWIDSGTLLVVVPHYDDMPVREHAVGTIAVSYVGIADAKK